MHNFQGSTLEYMKGDFDSISKNGKLNTVPISQGTMHVILSQATRRDKLQLVNFELEHIKVNAATLQEIPRMREEALFSRHHLSLEISGTNVALSDLQS